MTQGRMAVRGMFSPARVRRGAYPSFLRVRRSGCGLARDVRTSAPAAEDRRSFAFPVAAFIFLCSMWAMTPAGPPSSRAIRTASASNRAASPAPTIREAASVNGLELLVPGGARPLAVAQQKAGDR